MSALLSETVGSVEWWGAMTVWTALLLAVARILDRGAAGFADPAVRMLLYVPVFVRPLVPLRWASPLGVAPDVAGAVRAASTALGPVPETVAPVPTPVAALPVEAVLVGAWGLGVAVLLAVWMVRRRRLDRALRHTEVAERALAPGVVVLVHEALGPFVYGILHPVLVLPRSLAASSEPAAGHAVAHELAHLRRRDLLLAATLHLFSIALWPLIPVWLASRRVHLLLELAADADALRTLQGVEGRDYARTLLAFGHTPSVVSIGGFDMAVYDNLRERISAIVRPPRWPRRVTVPATLVVCALLVGLSTRVAASDGSGNRLIVGQSVDYVFEPGVTQVDVADQAVVGVNVSPNDRTLEIDGLSPGHTQVVLYKGAGGEPSLATYDVAPADVAALERDPSVIKIRRGEFAFVSRPPDVASIRVVFPEIVGVDPDPNGLRLTGLAPGYTDVVYRLGGTSTRQRVLVTAP